MKTRSRRTFVTTGSGNICKLTITKLGNNVGIDGDWARKPTKQDLDDVTAYCEIRFNIELAEMAKTQGKPWVLQ